MSNNLTKEEINEFKDKIIEIHENIIQISGGEQGIRDEGGLFYSSFKILSFIKKYRGNPGKLSAQILIELSIKHHFFDGNKRIAFVIMNICLLKINFYFKAEYEQILNNLLKITDNNLEMKKIENWLNSNLIKIKSEDIEIYLNETLHYKFNKNENQ